jgi:hypothetical protein
MAIRGGATLWARKTIESDIFIWRSDKWFKIWFFIVNNVSHKDLQHFPRGSGLMTYKDIREHTAATHGQVDKFIRYAKQSRMLTTRKTTRGMIVKVLNYDKYQTLDNYKVDTKVERPVELKSKRSRNGVDTIDKYVKYVKNDKYVDTNVSSEQSSHLTYLKNIPLQDLEEFEKRFDAYRPEIQGKAESLFLYCEAKGKRYKNYRSFLLNALKKDFKERPPKVEKPPEPKMSEEQIAENKKRLSEMKAKMFKK